MATILELQKQPGLEEAIAQAVATSYQRHRQAVNEEERVRKLRGAIESAGRAPDRTSAREFLMPLVSKTGDAATVEGVLNQMFPEQDEQNLVDAINTETGGLERIPYTSVDDLKNRGFRLATGKTNEVRLFKDQPELSLVGTFASGSKASKGLLTREEHKLKYGDKTSRSGGKTLDPAQAASARARIRASNKRNTNEPPLRIDNSEVFDRALFLDENDKELQDSIDVNFKKTFGFDITFAEEDLPIRNRASVVAQDLILREGMDINEAAEKSIKKVQQSMSDEEQAKLEELKNKKGPGAKDPVDKGGADGLLGGILESLGKMGQGEGVNAMPDPEAPQMSVPYRLQDGTPVTVDIPKRINLSANDANQQLLNYLTQEKNFSQDEAVQFILDNFHDTSGAF